MFVASRWVIQGAIRVKVHRIVRDVHMQHSVFFLQPSRAHGPYCTSTSIYIECAYARTLGRWRDEKRRAREKEKEREIERSKKRANDSRGEGTIKKKKEKKPRMRSCAFYRCGALLAKRMSVHAYGTHVRIVCVQMCADDRRTLPPLYVRLRTFAISLNPQTTSVRVGAGRFESGIAVARA